jgi:FtsZ-binding cell division protein ZapB
MLQSTRGLHAPKDETCCSCETRIRENEELQKTAVTLKALLQEKTDELMTKDAMLQEKARAAQAQEEKVLILERRSQQVKGTVVLY